MQVISKRALRLFWERHPRAEVPLKVWFKSVTSAAWSTPNDIPAQFGTADFWATIGLSSTSVATSTALSFASRIPSSVLIKFVGTHAEYDKIDAEAV